MATLITHPLVPIALAVTAGRTRVPFRLVVLGVLFSALPDLDVIAFRFGIPYADQWGHRGFSHSIAFAVLCAAAALPLAPALQARRLVAFLFLGLSMASHGVLDALTNAGHGVAFFWPLSDERHFFAFRPVDASPISLSRFFGGRGAEVLWTEVVWLWLPLGAFAALAFGLRRVLERSADDRAGA